MTKKVIQVPLDAALLRSLNACSEQEGRFRADLILAACRSYLKQRHDEELSRIYVEGYRRIPDDGKIGISQEAMLSEILEPEEW